MDVRIVLWTCLAMTSVLLCTHTLFLPTLFSIIVIGIIPGTSYVIPTEFMLSVYPILFSAGLYWLSTRDVLIEKPIPHTSAKPQKPIKKAAIHNPTINTVSRKRRARATI